MTPCRDYRIPADRATDPQRQSSTSLRSLKSDRIHDSMPSRKPRAVQEADPGLSPGLSKNDARPGLPAVPGATQRQRHNRRHEAHRIRRHRARVGRGAEGGRHHLRDGVRPLLLPQVSPRRPQREPAGRLASGDAQGVYVLRCGRAAELFQ